MRRLTTGDFVVAISATDPSDAAWDIGAVRATLHNTAVRVHWLIRNEMWIEGERELLRVDLEEVLLLLRNVLGEERAQKLLAAAMEKL